MRRVPRPESVRPPSTRPRDAAGTPPPAAHGLRGLVSRHLGPSLKFLTVGGTVFFIDAAVYNLLVFWTPGEGWGRGLLFHVPLVAKALSIAFASVLTYLGNRLWTFSDRTVPHTARSVAVFITINVIASLLRLAACVLPVRPGAAHAPGRQHLRQPHRPGHLDGVPLRDVRTLRVPAERRARARRGPLTGTFGPPGIRRASA